jgi:SsrA-binding protein
MTNNMKTIATNKKAFYEFHIIEKIETGIVLTGSEVKALRAGRCNFKDSHARIRDGEVWLIGMNIGSYKNAGYSAHEPERQRKLLLHKDEIKRFHRKVLEKGVTLIPLKIYFKKGIAKVEIGIATGKKEYDKRASIAKRDQEREIKRMEKKYRIR